MAEQVSAGVHHLHTRTTGGRVRFVTDSHTYFAAKAKGDQNVYFISGKSLMEKALDEGTVDGCHPTDYGFFSTTCAVEEVLKEII